MKSKNPTKHLAYRTTCIVTQEERKASLSALDKAIQSGERKEVKYEESELIALRDVQKMIFDMKPPKEVS